MSSKSLDIITMGVQQSQNFECFQSRFEFKSLQTDKKKCRYKLFCNELKFHNYIEPNYFTIHLPWDNKEFMKIILRQMSKRVGVTSLIYTNRSTEQTNILKINDSIQQNKNSPIDNLRNDYKKKYYKLLKSLKHDVEQIKQKTKREIFNKLTTSHEDLLRSQEENYEDIILQMTTTHEAKIKSVTKYYEDQLKEANKNEKNLKILSNQLKEQNQELVNTINLYEERLNNIQNLLLGRPPIDGNTKNTQIQEDEKQIIELKATLDGIKEKETQKEYYMKEMKNKEDQYNNEMKRKQKYIDQLLVQIKYHQDVAVENEKKRKEKEIQNCDLQKQLQCINMRHNEQFKNYEKLIVKSRSETEMHKREITRLQEHISSVNFTGSPAVRPKQILESTSSTKNTPRHTPKLTLLKLCEEDPGTIKYNLPHSSQKSQEKNTTFSNEILAPVTTKSAARSLQDKFEVINKNKENMAQSDNTFGISLSLIGSDVSSNPSTQQESIKSTQKSARKRGRPRKNPGQKSAKKCGRPRKSPAPE